MRTPNTIEKLSRIKKELISPLFKSFRQLVVIGLMPGLISGCNNSSNTKSSEDIGINHETTMLNKMSELKEEISEAIKFDVYGGFYDKDDIFDNISMTYDDPTLEKWIIQEIEKYYQQKLSEQSLWEPVTDFDRLAQVFDKLNSSGIIALHNAGYTRQDGEGDTHEIYEDLKGMGITTKGYCFYHTQDMERVIEGGSTLLLAFGDFEHDDKKGEAVGNEIILALHEKGFKTEWNNSIQARINVSGIKWQKRFGNENCSIKRAIDFLTNTAGK